MKFASLHNLPLRRKLTLLTMATSVVALLLACAAFVGYEQLTFRNTMARDLSITAEMFGANCAGALSFDEAGSAETTLKALQAQPHILAACIYNKDGRLFAQYRRHDQPAGFRLPPVAPDTQHFSPDRLELFHRIVLANEAIGTIYLASDLRELDARLQRYALIVLGVIAAASLVAFGLSTRLQRIISTPIFHLASTAARVAQEKNYSLRAVKHGEDELGRLIDAFNEMLGQIQQQDAALQQARDHLEQRVQERTRELQTEVQERKEAETRLESTHQQLLDVSRQAGMAEVATGVLHNVGNVLNSVNVSASLVEGQLRKSKVSSLTRAVTLLKEHAADLAAFLTHDPKGKGFPGFLEQLASVLTTEQATALAEIDLLKKNIEHIKEIVVMQQSYSKVSGLTENLNLTDLVEDSLRFNENSLDRHDIKLVREFSTVPPVTVEKHKVLQILVNLVRNAKHACEAVDRPDKQVTVRIAQADGRAQIVVRDNGVGIPPENLTRIFAHGFTTKKNGHGFGLHSGALAARELGGDLSVASDGVGRGATFTLELPWQPPKQF